MLNTLIGMLIGAFVSLVGGGGASLYLAVLGSQLPTTTAVSTSLFVALPALLAGTLSQIHIHNVRFKIGNRLLITAILVGTAIGKFIPERALAIVVGAILAIMGIIVLARNLHGKHRDSAQPATVRPVAAYLFGALSGFMVGVGGLSGGTTTVAALSMLGVAAFEAAGTTTYVLAAMSAVGFLTHLLTSTIAWQAGFTLMVGAVIGSILTPLLLNRLDISRYNRQLGILLGSVIVFFGTKMILGL